MKVFVTGTAGFIGFHLARRLIADGHEVLGYDGMTQYYDVALKAVEQLKSIAGDVPLAQFALKWITSFDAVTCAIPGAKTPAQAESNFAVSDLPILTTAQLAAVEAVYGALIRPLVHQRW